MANLIKEGYRVTAPIPPQSVNSEAMGSYIPMAHNRRALAVMTGGEASAGETFKLELHKAKDADGTDDAVMKEAEGVANENVKKVDIDISQTANGDTLMVNGHTYQKVDSDPNTEEGEYDNAAALAGLIDALDGLSASESGDTVAVEAADGYTVTAAVGETDEGTTEITTKESVVIVEIHERELGEGYEYVAPKAVVTSTGTYSCTLLLEGKLLTVPQGNLAAEA